MIACPLETISDSIAHESTTFLDYSTWLLHIDKLSMLYFDTHYATTYEQWAYPTDIPISVALKHLHNTEKNQEAAHTKKRQGIQVCIRFIRPFNNISYKLIIERVRRMNVEKAIK